VRRLHREVVQGKKVPDVDRAFDFIDKPFLNTEPPASKLTIFFGAPGSISSRTPILVRTILDLRLHRLQDIHHLIFVEIIIVVARDAKCNDVFDLHPGEEPVNMATDKFVEKDEMVPVRPGIHGHKPRQDGGHFDEGIGLGHLYAARFLENNHEVQTEIPQERERVSRIDSQRGEDGKYLSLEVVIKSPGLFVIEVLDTVKKNPGLRESRQHHIRDAPVLFGNEDPYPFRDLVQLLPDRPAACVDAADIRTQDTEEPAHTDHEVFVEV